MTILEYLLEFPNYLSTFIFSFFLMLSSTILIEMGNSFNTDPGNLSLVFTFCPIGVILGQSTSVFYGIKFKKIKIIIISYILLTGMALGLFLTKSLIIFYILYFIAGYIMGVLAIQANELLLISKIKNKDRLITISYTFWPIGALVGPIISSNVVNAGINWKYIYIIFIIILLFILLLYILVGHRKYNYTAAAIKEKIRFREIFTIRKNNIILIIIIISLIIFSLSENIIYSWVPTFFRSERMFDINNAGILISLYFIGVIIGRTFISIIAGRIDSNKVMLISLLFSLISLTCLFIINTKIIVFIMIFITGLCYAGIFPLLISSGSSIYANGKGILLTLLLNSSAIGAAISPFITKYVANFNMALSVSLTLIYTILLIILVLASNLYRKHA